MTLETSSADGRPLTRRAFLGVSVGAIATLALASCTPAPTWITPGGVDVERAEQDRSNTGRLSTVALTAAPFTLDLAGTAASTFAFGSVPGPVIRLVAGDTLRASVRNELPVDTSIHWHGLAL